VLLLGKICLIFYGGYNHLESRLLSYGHFVKELWMLQGIEDGALVKTSEFS